VAGAYGSALLLSVVVSAGSCSGFGSPMNAVVAAVLVMVDTLSIAGQSAVQIWLLRAKFLRQSGWQQVPQQITRDRLS
jgi:acid phosphatase family membrane protein YuiD